MRYLPLCFALSALFLLSCRHPQNPEPEPDPSGTYSLKSAFRETLFTLDSTLLTLQVTHTGDETYGALWCPLCQLYHTRAAEAVYPFAFQFSLNGDTNFCRAAIRLGNWLIRQQESDGSWKETPEEWTGTTTDQLLAMAQAFPLLEEYLTGPEKEQWMGSMKAAGDYLAEVMDPAFASINYVATTAATMAVLNRLIPDTVYGSKAHEMAHRVVAMMDPDHFITGEGGRVNGVKYGVDLTYNMEMSLWGLALYARISGDDFVWEQVRESLERHLWFINPDGSLDGSWGIRSNKWTCFGGATSDGSQVLFSLFAGTDPVCRTAALRNLDYLQQCMAGGFLGYGPLHREALSFPPCIYPTFARAKNLAMAHALCTSDQGAAPPLPADLTGMEHFPTLDVTRVRTGNFMATVTAYTYKDPKGALSKYMFRPAGGAISSLWLKGYGFLTASSQTEYHRWEPMSFPVMEENLRPLTPRIEYGTRVSDSRKEGDTHPAEHYFTNLFEFDATTTRQEMEGKFVITATGRLKNRNQADGGVDYRYRYLFGDSLVEKGVTLRFHARRDTVRIIEPVITYPGTVVVQEDDRTVAIRQGETRVTFRLISGNATLSTGIDQSQYRSVYPALTACPIVMTAVPGENDTEEIVFNYTVE